MKNSKNEPADRSNTQVLEIEDIIEDETDERDKERSEANSSKKRERSKSRAKSRMKQKNDRRAENGENVNEVRPDSATNIVTRTSPSSQPVNDSATSNVKSFSSKLFAVFAMNLPASVPDSLESIIQDDSSCCNRMICCPEIIRRQDVNHKFFGQKWCLDWATIFKVLANIMILAIFWGWLFLWLGDLAWPGGKLFDLLSLTLSGYLIGWALSYIPYLRIPPIVGMLLVGIMARNMHHDGKPLYQVSTIEDDVFLQEKIGNITELEQSQVGERIDYLGYSLAGNLRSFCLTFVMMRAGLQIDASKLARHRHAICHLGIIPGSVECIVVAIAAWNWIEVDMNATIVKPLPFVYSLMTGAIVAVMSPVTAIQCAFELEEQGYSKAIATIIYTATSIDSVYMVSLFSFFYSFALRLWGDASSKHQVKKSFQSTYALVAGALVGLTFGVIFTFFPHRHSPFAFWFRVLNLNFACIFCTCWGYNVANIGAGLLGTCVTCFVALTGWRIIDKSFKGAKRVRVITGILWHIAQPFLVVGIGVEIDLSIWKLERAIWQIYVLGIGLVSRFISAIYVAHRHEINWNESIFLALAWTPKGHIQAAIAPLAYQTLRVMYNKNTVMNKQHLKEEIEYAQVLMMISFMTVIIMGPLGSMLIMGLGPRLLTKHELPIKPT